MCGGGPGVRRKHACWGTGAGPREKRLRDSIHLPRCQNGHLSLGFRPPRDGTKLAVGREVDKRVTKGGDGEAQHHHQRQPDGLGQLRPRPPRASR